MKNSIHFLCLSVGGNPNGVVGKCVMEIDEDILRWKQFNYTEMDFLVEHQSHCRVTEKQWTALKELYNNPSMNIVHVCEQNSSFVYGYNVLEFQRNMYDRLYSLLDNKTVQMVKTFIEKLNWFYESNPMIDLMARDIINFHIPVPHKIIDDPYQMNSEEDVLWKVMKTNEDICFMLSWLDWSAVSECVMLRSDGYRGVLLYNGALKIGDAWFWLDLMDGNLTYIENWESKDVQNIISPNGLKIMCGLLGSGSHLGSTLLVNVDDTKITNKVVELCIEKYCNELVQQEDIHDTIKFFKEGSSVISETGFTVKFDEMIFVGLVVKD